MLLQNMYASTTPLTNWLTKLPSQNNINCNNSYISAIWSDKSPKSYLVIKIWQWFLKSISNLWALKSANLTFLPHRASLLNVRWLHCKASVNLLTASMVKILPLRQTKKPWVKETCPTYSGNYH